MLTFRLSVQGDLDRVLAQYPNKVAIPAMSAALNKSAGLTRTAAIKRLREQTKVPAKAIRPRVRFGKARPKPDKLRAFLYVLTQGILVRDLKVRENKRGITVAGQKIPDAFKARMRSGYESYFQRQTPSQRKSAGAWSKNLPIREVNIPIRDRANAIFPAEQRRVMRARFNDILQRELKFRVERLNRRARRG